MTGITQTDIDRFWTRVRKTKTCWLWTGTTTADGYGIVTPAGKRWGVHRFSYVIARGRIPDNMVIDHICRVRLCVNPEHLRIVTKKQNSENLPEIRANNKSGYRGVAKQGNRWRADVSHNGRKIYIGLFTTPELAGAAAHAKRMELFTHNEEDRK